MHDVCRKNKITQNKDAKDMTHMDWWQSKDVSGLCEQSSTKVFNICRKKSVTKSTPLGDITAKVKVCVCETVEEGGSMSVYV